VGEFITSGQDGLVTVVTISNPPMNQLSAALLEELEAEIDRLDGDDGTRAIVLRGGGDRAFVAGADIKEFPSLRESAASNEGGSARRIQKVGQRMDAARKPFVAAIQGYCLGGGLELAMCCDVRVCADDAQLGQPEIKLGIIPGAGGTQRLPRLVGPARAKDIIYSGRFVPAKEALDIGLVDEMFPSADVYERAVEKAREYATGPTAALRAAKVSVNWGGRVDLRTGLVIERETFVDLFATEDQKEGMSAFVEKRKAEFKGK